MITTIEIDTYWSEMWKSLGASHFPWEYIDLQRFYLESRRKYHNLSYLAYCFMEFEKVKERLSDPMSTVCAIWYHRAILVPFSEENEERSAALVYDFIAKKDVNGQFVEGKHVFAARVAKMILAMKYEEVSPTSDAAYFLDITRSIFGQEEEMYDHYEKNIREESRIGETAVYREERARTLQQILSRKNIFVTEFFRQEYEEQARKNIKRTLSKFRSS